MKLAMLMILAPDLEEERSFYCGVLGFGEIRPQDTELKT
jgi:catechol 2,3-dioxygenase-like lactoylglutathione lyase family enzyme